MKNDNVKVVRMCTLKGVSQEEIDKVLIHCGNVREFYLTNCHIERLESLQAAKAFSFASHLKNLTVLSCPNVNNFKVEHLPSATLKSLTIGYPEIWEFDSWLSECLCLAELRIISTKQPQAIQVAYFCESVSCHLNNILKVFELSVALANYAFEM